MSAPADRAATAVDSLEPELFTSQDAKQIQKDIRQTAIDVLQCGNYLETSKFGPAYDNITTLVDRVVNLKKLIDKKRHDAARR